MTDLGEQITQHLVAEKIIVVCGRDDDARAWIDLLGAKRCLAIALDATPVHARTRPVGASGHLAWQTDTIRDIDTRGRLAQQVNAFDPDLTALLIFPDPLDPPHAGVRHRLGRRPHFLRLLEDKTVIDTLWDRLGLARAESIVIDTKQDLAMVGTLVDRGSGVVCSTQSASNVPTTGGDNIWWWRNAEPPKRVQSLTSTRVRLMPLLEGLPIRLHGLVTGSDVIVFPPMEIVSLPRPEHGTFLLAGAVPTAQPHCNDLVKCTEHIGSGLSMTAGYRGAFSVDGVLTIDGFRPTDFNARLGSAIESTPPELRVRLQAANLLIRDGTELDPATVRRLTREIFERRPPTHTLYGAATIARYTSNRFGICWAGTRLASAAGRPEHGHITIVPSIRGWLVTTTLLADRIPTGGPVGALAPQVFRLSDEVFGTDFGYLIAPFGT